MTGWKTAAFNFVLMFWGFLESMDVTTVLGDNAWAGLIVAAIGGIGMVLRAVTTTPIFKASAPTNG